ncbi:hypothetical protein LUZ63_015476 [Rhynchospora breviuscula]|uniref:DCD domain-containing protein n=1 Tax=Rhynchospora breviuscula TaxID=2022672 RepID=A0A9Q0CCE5_9POAL|nr:hypothetical protein LUZ63_015476 [Rhynchospora breviuscula]
MGAGRKTETYHTPANFNYVASAAPGSNSMYHGFRNLHKSDLGGVIFGCKNNTMQECLTKQLFGLPSTHYSYIRNIDAGLPLFLFNYSDRTMHGIFKAAGSGEMNIDPYAWSDDGTVKTPYPAQVRILTKTSCLPLSEDQFKKVIGDNYYTPSHFWFELDHAQTKKLISFFKPSNQGYAPISIPASHNIPSTTLSNAQPNISYRQTLLKHLNPSNLASAPPSGKWGSNEAISSNKEVKDHWEMQDTWANKVEGKENYWEVQDTLVNKVELKENCNNDTESGHDAVNNKNYLGFGLTQVDVASESGFDEQTVLNKLRALASERVAMIGCTSENLGNELALDADPKIEVAGEPSVISHTQLTQSNGNHELIAILKEQVFRITGLQKKQVESDNKIKWLEDIDNQSRRKIFQLESRLEKLEQMLGISAEYMFESSKLIYLVGGFNSLDWLTSFDAFVPSKDRLMPLKRMSIARAYTSVATLGEVIFVFGGGDGNSWSDIVECYKRSTNEWIQCPPLSCSKGSLAGITLGGKIFAIGGGDGENCFSSVEILDPSVEKWVYGESMNEKRFAPAAIDFKGAIYTVGGYDGKSYLSSAERYDPREGYWARLPSMTERRGCLSLANVNEKLYAVGGYDGAKMVSSVEIFDPRLPAWVPGMSMQKARGYAASAVINDTLYMMGGLSNGDEVTEIVECFDQSNGWYAPGFTSIGRRCFFSAVVM